MADYQDQCFTCHRAEQQGGAPLLLCAKCKKQRYCSRECQRADWRRHKPECIDPFTQINTGQWFFNRPEKDVYKLLIDIYRMKVEDDYVFEGEIDDDSLYSGAGSKRALKHFRRFLQQITRSDARRDSRLLPEWWSQDKVTECVNFAEVDGWSFIGYAVEKHDIQEHYKQDLMPMHLRMMKEKLTGERTAGQSCDPMLALLAGLQGI